MWKIILFCMLLNCNSGLTAELKCSTSGTRVLHVPGAFTSSKARDNAYTALFQLIVGKTNLIDLKIQSSLVIPVKSQGYLQDKFNYIFNSLGSSDEYT